MSDAMKTIFKTLIKVPVIIAIITLLFNIFAFTNTYFKLLSVSYAIQNVVIQNNYIPSAEYTTLTNTMNGMRTAILTNIRLTNEYQVTQRRQYGQTVECGIEANFHWIIPGMPRRNPTSGPIVDATGTFDRTGTQVIWDDRVPGTTIWDSFTTVPIKISYIVPGMKYYPDM